MAESANGRLDKPVDSTSSSTAEMKAAIRATRRRLTTRLAETAEHVHVVLTVPSATSFTQEGPRVGGFIGGAINTLAVVGRTKRVWSKARRSGVARRAGIVAATITIAVAIAAKARRGRF